MKKIFMLLTVLSLSLSAGAQSYRGMFDINVGLVNAGNKHMKAGGRTFDFKPSMGFQVTTSHGCQITPFLFAGAGVGVNLALTELYVYSPTVRAAPEYPHAVSGNKQIYALHLPVFIDVRWDLDVRRKITPFVDIKAGYQIKLGDCYAATTNNSDDWWDYAYAKVTSGSSVFFQPTAGVRFRIGNHSGFNLGIAYNTTLKRELVYEDKAAATATDGMVMLNLGFDF